ncbi:uncharacterized protein LOC119151095 isoform X3 [Falco rusticolus]|uniref:uncharacterized protein LOC119151095 isoform X3 n=1 Tax=Falco rusticolus TaxID=120794 RepID=UPI001886A8B9|nr:uncharacterized protein LOC119151095 isoform X3 [Falco rusticolus]
MSAGRGSRSALQEDPQSPFAEILVRAPEKPEIHPPSPLCPDLSETRGSAECHWRAHVAVPAPVPSSGRYRLFQTLFTARGSLGSWLQERVRRAAGCAEGLREPVRRLPLFGRRWVCVSLSDTYLKTMALGFWQKKLFSRHRSRTYDCSGTGEFPVHQRGIRTCACRQETDKRREGTLAVLKGKPCADRCLLDACPGYMLLLWF